MATKSTDAVLVAAAQILQPGPLGAMKNDVVSCVVRTAPAQRSDDTADDKSGVLTANAMRELCAKMYVTRALSHLRGYDLPIGKA